MTLNHFFDGDDRAWRAVQPAGPSPVQRRRAVMAVLSSATDAVDARNLLDMLGLDPAAVRGSEETAA
jgi:hypothetical protein